jgi:hypothetical protein
MKRSDGLGSSSRRRASGINVAQVRSLEVSFRAERSCAFVCRSAHSQPQHERSDREQQVHGWQEKMRVPVSAYHNHQRTNKVQRGRPRPQPPTSGTAIPAKSPSAPAALRTPSGNSHELDPPHVVMLLTTHCGRRKSTAAAYVLAAAVKTVMMM